MFLQPAKLCYVLHRPHNNTMFSVNQYEGATPTVVAFRNKAMASRFSRLVTSLEADKIAQRKHAALQKKHSDPLTKIVETLKMSGLTNHANKIDVCTLHTDSLSKRCKMGGLQLMLVDENGEHTLCESKFDEYEYRFHLDEVFHE